MSRLYRVSPQVVWKPVQNKAPDLYNFIENFSFDWGEYIDLLEMFNEAEDGESHMEDVACAWLNHEVVSHSLDHFSQEKTEYTQPWYRNFPVTRKNHLYIGMITLKSELSFIQHCFHFHV